MHSRPVRRVMLWHAGVGTRVNMRDDPLVSILIPVYNREQMIVTALSSAMAQTYSNIEIVVVDNGSTDRTFEVAHTYAQRDDRIRCFRNEENLGPVRNWMECLAHSSGAYIKFLFSDDWLDYQAVERLLAPLTEHPEAGFSYSAVEVHYETMGSTWRWYQQEGSRLMDSFEFLRGVLTESPSVPTSPGCALFRRKDVEHGLQVEIPNRLGLACGQVGFGPDLMLFLRACDAYPKVCYVASVLSHFRGHEGSITVADRGRLGDLCYDVAFSWFLATSKLPPGSRQYFSALLFIRTLSASRMNVVNLRNPWQVYARMFPDWYAYWAMNPFSRDAAVMLFRRALHFSRSMTKTVRRPS